MTPTKFPQIHELALVRSFFKGEPFFKDKTLIIWHQSFNVEVSNYFEKCFDWWVKVEEDDQGQSEYTVFEVTVDQTRDFLGAAHDEKWGIGSCCFVFENNELYWGRD